MEWKRTQMKKQSIRMGIGINLSQFNKYKNTLFKISQPNERTKKKATKWVAKMKSQSICSYYIAASILTAVSLCLFWHDLISFGNWSHHRHCHRRRCHHHRRRHLWLMCFSYYFDCDLRRSIWFVCSSLCTLYLQVAKHFFNHKWWRLGRKKV